jgi:ERCC4-type nuclease
MVTQEVVKNKYVDSNEPWDIREQMLTIGWEQKGLVSGDYFFWSIDWKKIGIERKTVEDLLGSLSKRLAQQLDNMLNFYDFSILLIEGYGNLKQVVDTGQIVTSRGVEQWYMKTLRNFLRSWQDRGLTLEMTTSSKDTVRRVNEIYAYYQKEVHTSGLKRQYVGDRRLLAFPEGVGIKTAKKILDEMGSLHNVACVSKEELMTIDGVGEKRAEDIKAFYWKNTLNGEVKDETVLRDIHSNQETREDAKD